MEHAWGEKQSEPVTLVAPEELVLQQPLRRFQDPIDLRRLPRRPLLGNSVNKEGRIASSCSFSVTYSLHESLVQALLRILYMLVVFAVNQPLKDRTRFIRVSSPFAPYHTVGSKADTPTLSRS